MSNALLNATPVVVEPVLSSPCDLQSCMLERRRVSRLSEAALLAEVAATLAHERGYTVRLLLLLGAIEARAIHRTRACDSLYTWCTEVLHMSEGAAYKRIRAARVAERFPVVLPMLADGRLHLSAVVLLAPYLTGENVSELLASATHLSKAAVERLVAERFPKPDVPTAVRALDAGGSRPAPTATAQVVANIAAQLSPGTVDPAECAQSADLMGPLSAPDESRALQEVMARALGDAAAKCGAEALSEPVISALAGSLADVIVSAAQGVSSEGATSVATAADPPARVTPRSAGRYAWQLTADKSMQELFEEARDLLGPGGERELADVLKAGLELLVQMLRKKKLAATSKPQPARVTSMTTNARYVPRAVVRAVHERDGGQCAFVGPDGRRCTARSNLQLDHVVPFARGGRTTTENLRQLCAAHNRYEAERAFGSEHVSEQRSASRARAKQASARRAEALAARERKPRGRLPGSSTAASRALPLS